MTTTEVAPFGGILAPTIGSRWRLTVQIARRERLLGHDILNLAMVLMMKIDKILSRVENLVIGRPF